MVGFTTKEFFPAMVEGTVRRAALLLAVTTLCGCALGQAQVFTVEREHLGAEGCKSHHGSTHHCPS